MKVFLGEVHRAGGVVNQRGGALCQLVFTTWV